MTHITLGKKLEILYDSKIAQNKVSMIRKLVNSKYKDGQGVTEHLSDFQEVLNEFSSIKLVSDDEVQELLLLSSLPDSYKTSVV